MRAEWIAMALSAVLVGAVASAAPAPVPASAVRVAVEGDLAAYALPGQGEGRGVMVYLHGRCGDPFAGVRSFPEAARRHGTMVVVEGDVPCKNRPGRRSWSNNAAKIQARIDAAVAAASEQLKRPLDADKLTLIGYSEGALRAELLAGAFPARYPRVVLGGEPRTPSPRLLSGANAVVTLAGERDDQSTMRQGADALAKAGIVARFWLLPGARHGQYGPEGDRVLGEALGWLFARR